MSQFPWAAVLPALVALILGAVPLVTSLSLDARIGRTVKQLSGIAEYDKNSQALAALDEALKIQTARKLGRLKHGAYVWWYAGSLVSGSLFLGHFTGAWQLNSANYWLTLGCAIAFGIFSAVSYWQYSKLVEKHS